MVERLTYRPEAPYTNGKGERIEAYSDYTAREIINCLAAYEDIGTIEELAALKARTRWIPVSERLPERRIPVLVYNPMWVRPVLALCRDDDEFWTGTQAVTPTHWMQLPEAPKEAVHE